jgi:hypothetical protein
LDCTGRTSYDVFVLQLFLRVCPEMPENEEAATAVYAKMVHKGVADDVNRAISGQTLLRDGVLNVGS